MNGLGLRSKRLRGIIGLARVFPIAWHCDQLQRFFSLFPGRERDGRESLCKKGFLPNFLPLPKDYR